jgi:hypothetical protein
LTRSGYAARFTLCCRPRRSRIHLENVGLIHINALNNLDDLLLLWRSALRRSLKEAIMRIRSIIPVAFAAALTVSSANAASVVWTDLTSDNGSTTVSGTIGSVVVTSYSQPGYLFAQINNVGTDYWAVPINNPYTGGVVNRPTSVDYIALIYGGTNTITFSQPVTNVYLALDSWDGNTATFSAPFTIVSQGCGYWGCGGFTAFNNNYSFAGNGNQPTGVLEFAGTFTSLTFTDTPESWHGFTVGIDANATPLPAALPLFATGLGALGLLGWRRKRKAAALA